MLEGLSESLKETLKKITTLDFLSDSELNTILRELQRTLIRADVSIDVVSALSNSIKEKMKKTTGTLTKKQKLITLIYEEILSFMGEGGESFQITKKPFKIMLLGLFGSGKTTTAGKLAKLFKAEGYKTALVSLDNYRPAAYEQLQQLGDNIHVPVYGKKKLKKQMEPWKDNEKQILKSDLIIIDTAGRDSLHDNFLKELKELSEKIKPDEILLVIPAEIGQGVKELTENFAKTVNITGIIITKLDTSAKGGGALTSSYLTKKPVKYITTGESADEIELFKPKRFVSRLLGMGDLESLLEKAQKELDTKKTEDITKKIMSGKSDFLDFYEQIQSMNKMGGIKKIMSMLPQMPGVKLKSEMFETSKDKIEGFKTIMQSMTEEELKNPKVINASRVTRIAKGSGKEERDVRELVKSHKKMNQMTKQMNTRQIQKLAKKFGMG